MVIENLQGRERDSHRVNPLRARRALRGWLRSVVVCLVFIIALPARGYLRQAPEDSIEWTVASSDAIVCGVVETIGQAKAKINVVTMRVNQNLKDTTGGIAAGGRISFLVQSGRPIEVGNQYLIFLVTISRVSKEQSWSADIDAAFRAYAFVARNDWNRNPLPLGHQGTSLQFCNLDGNRIPPDDLLRVIGNEIARPALARPEMLELQISPQSEAYRSSEHTFPAYLNILLDDRAESRAKKWIASKNEHDRWNGASALSHFKSDANVALLRGLLDDPFATDYNYWPGGSDFMPPPMPGKWRSAGYAIRKVAYAALNKWGLAPAEAILERPVHPPVYLSRTVLWMVPGILGVILFVVLLRGWFAAGRRILAGLSGVSLILLVLFAALWVRSIWRIDEVGLNSGEKRRYEIASLAGSLRIARFEGENSPVPPALTTVPTSAASDWDLGATVKTMGTPSYASTGYAGFHHEKGTMMGPDFQTMSFAAWSVPYWALCVPLSILPLFRIIGYLRWRKRSKRGLCLSCGYDLRASTHRCPECGAEIPAT